MWCVDRSYLVSVDFTVFDSIGNISCEDLLENCNDNQRNQQIQLMKYIYISGCCICSVRATLWLCHIRILF